MAIQIRRRDFITLLGGAAAAWPVAAQAQQGERVRRIGVLMYWAEDDAEGQARLGAFLQGLQQTGWVIGRNVSVETRWAAGDAESIRRHAAELVALAPDVILATGSASVGPLLQATRSVPVVFALVPDPVGRHHDVIRLSPLKRVKQSCGGHRQRTEFDPTGQSPAPPSANSTGSNFPETTGGTRQHRRALPITSPERETSSLLSFHGASRDAADEAVEEKVVRDCHRDARDQRRAHQFAPVEDVAANEVGRDPQGDGLFLR